jgi:hypothetical protein
VGKPEGKRPLGRLRRRRENRIKIKIAETGWVDVGWIHIAQDTDKLRAFVSAVINFLLR